MRSDHFPALKKSNSGRWYLCWSDADGNRHRAGPYDSRREAELAGVELQYPLGRPQNKNVWDPTPCRGDRSSRKRRR